jgi:hypothetical protein
MTVSELIQKLQEMAAAGQSEFEVKVLESVSGDLAEINAVNFSGLNGGEIHIAIELEYEG